MQIETRRRVKGKFSDPRKPVIEPLQWSVAENGVDSRAMAFACGAAVRPAMDAWHDCDIKRHCQLIRQLGDGTYGKVFAGKYVGEWQQVAVKVSTANRVHHSVSPAEIALMTRVGSHPNVICMRDYFYSPFFTVMVLELFDESLHDTLSKRSSCGGLQPDVARQVTRMVASGVAHLHQKCILHRDLHLGNILCRFAPGLQPGRAIAPVDLHRVCVADLGQGCDTFGDKPFERRSAIVGARLIVPPECHFGRRGAYARYDTPIDIWAIGDIIN